MTLVKLNQKPFEKTLNALVDDFFHGLPVGLGGTDWTPQSHVPVNIRETAEAYQLELVAPGLEKGDFKVNIDKNIMTISADKKTETKNENERLIRREYTYKTFSRSFTLDDTINASGIAAKYDNGVLYLTLPKKEEVKLMPKEIAIQ